MSIEIKVPVLPESVADAVIANWYKQVGESIDVDEVLVDLETDKVILEVPTIKQGVVKEILFSVGDTVTAGQLLAVIDNSPTAVASKATRLDNTNVEKGVKSNGVDKEVAAMSPSVRKMVAENSVDERQLGGSGKAGRIIKKDVEKYLADLSQSKTDSDSPQQDVAQTVEIKSVVSG